jgi:hypothetical protein
MLKFDEMYAQLTPQGTGQSQSQGGQSQSQGSGQGVRPTTRPMRSGSPASRTP